jgi:hypothetical protein
MADIMTLRAARIRQIATIFWTLSEQSALLFHHGFLGLAAHYEAIAANLEAATGSMAAGPAHQQRSVYSARRAPATSVRYLTGITQMSQEARKACLEAA